VVVLTACGLAQLTKSELRGLSVTLMKVDMDNDRQRVQEMKKRLRKERIKKGRKKGKERKGHARKSEVGSCQREHTVFAQKR
jgi:hypothetical protein